MINIETLKMMEEIRHDFYYDLKGMFLFHTNKMEGSTFTQLELTTLINENIVTGRHEFDDVMETRNSIELFDYCIKSLGSNPLSKFEIREMHSILKRGTRDERMGFVGKFKPIPNAIRGSEVKLSDPWTVENDLDNLLSMEINTIDDIAKFHMTFEQIHPFTDGNGRIGRMLMMKQCFEAGLTPVFITDDNAGNYKKALETSQITGDVSHVVNIFKAGQNIFKGTEIYNKLIDLDVHYIKFKATQNHEVE